MVVSFARGLTIKCDVTGDRKKIRDAIRGTGRGLSTHLYDAMDKLMEEHLVRIPGRKAVVLFTDGVDATSSDSTYRVRPEQPRNLTRLSIRFSMIRTTQIVIAVARPLRQAAPACQGF